MLVEPLQYATMAAFLLTFTDALKGACSVDAAMVWVGNYKTYLFSGNKYVKWNSVNDQAGPWSLISSSGGWPGIPDDLDAATGWRVHNYFFKGCNYWKYGKNGVVGGPLSIQSGWGSPCDIDAAMKIDAATFLFKGDNYVRWDALDTGENKKTTGTIRSLGWNTVEGSLDAAIVFGMYAHGVYLFKGKYYWKFGNNKVSDKLEVFKKGNWDLLESNLLVDCACDCMSCCNKKWELDGPVRYTLDSGKLTISSPKIAGTQVVDNRSGTGNPSIGFTVSSTVIEGKTFTNKIGAALEVGTKFITGVPLIVYGEISAKVSSSYEHNWGTSTTTKKTKSAHYKCPAPPGKLVTCTVKFSTRKMDIPYKMTLKHKDKGCKCESEGVYKDVSTSQMHMEIKEE